MENCYKCERSEVKLLDAIYENEIVKICEECSVIENLPIIRKPSSFQLKESEKPYNVYQRLSRMSGVKREEKKPEIKLENLRKPKDYKVELEKKFSIAKSKNIPLNLVDNFNWLISMERKKRKISRKQLADSIGESEEAIKMIENNQMPDDALTIIKKIEQYFGFGLRNQENFSKTENSMPKAEPARVLKFDKEATKNLTIDDLRRMKEARENEGKTENKVSSLIWQGKTENKEDQEIIEETKAEEKPAKKGIFNFLFGRTKKEKPGEEINNLY